MNYLYQIAADLIGIWFGNFLTSDRCWVISFYTFIIDGAIMNTVNNLERQAVEADALQSIVHYVDGQVRIKTFNEAVRLINAHELGNGISCCTSDGTEGVRFYTRQKSVVQRWPASVVRGAEFSMLVPK